MDDRPSYVAWSRRRKLAVLAAILGAWLVFSLLMVLFNFHGSYSL